MVKDAIRHTISEDMEVLEVDSAKEVLIIPMKQKVHRLRCHRVRAESEDLSHSHHAADGPSRDSGSSD